MKCPFCSASRACNCPAPEFREGLDRKVEYRAYREARRVWEARQLRAELDRNRREELRAARRGE